MPQYKNGNKSSVSIFAGKCLFGPYNRDTATHVTTTWQLAKLLVINVVVANLNVGLSATSLQMHILVREGLRLVRASRPT